MTFISKLQTHHNKFREAIIESGQMDRFRNADNSAQIRLEVFQSQYILI